MVGGVVVAVGEGICGCGCDRGEGFEVSGLRGVSFFRKSRRDGSKSRMGSFDCLSSAELHNHPIVTFLMTMKAVVWVEVSSR